MNKDMPKLLAEVSFRLDGEIDPQLLSQLPDLGGYPPHAFLAIAVQHFGKLEDEPLQS